MKKVVIIPDSFKGTMSSQTVCDNIYQAIKAHHPEAEIIAIPVADGGEGTVDAYLAAVGGIRKTCVVTGPLFEKITTYYGILNDGTAVIEMASCAGLPLVEGKKDPMLATTYGVGELIMDAVLNHCKRIVVGLGGSCTNDGGTGVAAALGVKFYDKNNNTFIPTGGSLSKIKRIDASGCMPELKDVEIIIMCDVNNPFYGTKGAAYIYGPQKGASNDDVVFLDGQLRYLAELIKKELDIDISELPGAGAAGGMGGGMVAFFNATVKIGIETVLDIVKFDYFAKDADLVISGEGRLDKQSLNGKVIAGVAKRCKKLRIPLIAIVGDIVDDDIKDIYDLGVTAVFNINRTAVDFSISRNSAEKDLKSSVDNIIRLINRLKIAT